MHESDAVAALSADLAAATPADVAACRAVAASVVAAYTAPGRRYHDLRHIGEVLTALDELQGEAVTAGDDPSVQARGAARVTSPRDGRGAEAAVAAGHASGPERAARLAAWFHDVVHASADAGHPDPGVEAVSRADAGNPVTGRSETPTDAARAGGPEGGCSDGYGAPSPAEPARSADALRLPGESDEDASARWARRDLAALGAAESLADLVAAFVRLTATHEADVAGPARPAAEALLDADLWILASPAERFDEYCDQVRAEYAHVPAPAYAAGRTQILAALVDRPHVYATPAARRRWEARARANVARELARLAG